MKLKKIQKSDIIEYWGARKIRREEILEKRRESTFSKKIKPYMDFLNRISLILHALLACMLNFVIEIISRHSLIEAWDFLVKTPQVFLYNSFLIFITFSVVYIVKRRLFTRIIISVLWLILGICNGYMLMKRVTPFNAQDLKVAKDAISLMNSYFSVFEIVLIVVGVVAVIIWLVSMWRRGAQFQGKMHRILATIMCFVWLGVFLVVSNIAIDKRVVSNYFGNIAFAYEDYGFPYCFMSSVFNTGIAQPNGYDEEMIMEITNDGEMSTKTIIDDEDENKPNIIVVQLESFFDPEEVEFFEMSEDPIPNFRSLMEEYSSGYFKVPSVGAGTANTEFEVVTGMNMRYFGPGEYPYKTVLKEKTTESAATSLASLGYGAHAFHNNGGNFYSRSTVYNNLGFDSYTSKEFMNILQLTPMGWAKDNILTRYITDVMDSTEQQDFVFAISVEGHGSYPEEQILENPEITISGIEDEGLKNSWEYFISLVSEMDKFVGDLIAEIEARDEPSVVVFYGDHLPTLGLETNDLKSRYLYNTNYVIWDNIGLEEKNQNLAAYQLMAEVFEQIGIESGTVFNYHQERRKTKNYLEDLELLQYDLLYGDQFSYQGKDIVDDEGHMQMGTKDVTITDIVEQLDSTYCLYGTNFTKWSRVFVNGERQSATFLNNTRINLKKVILEEGDIITISQVGSSNTIFRTSASYEYRDGELVVVKEVETKKSWQAE